MTKKHHCKYVWKSTAVWLFQEGERVSSDRLFCVRAAQPICSSSSNCESDSEFTDSEVPFVATQLKGLSHQVPYTGKVW